MVLQNQMVLQNRKTLQNQMALQQNNLSLFQQVRHGSGIRHVFHWMH